MHKVTEESFIDRLSKINPNIEYMDGFSARNKPVHVRCKIDGYDWIVQARTLLNGSHCPCCTYKGRTPIVSGINDISTTHPQIASLIKDKSLLPKISHGMIKKFEFICPNCGETVLCSPNYVCRNNRVPCKCCGDGVSYPEKFLYSIFKQLNIPFETQKRYEWSNGKKYDFAGKDWILETHGEQHYNGRERGNRRSLDVEIANDKYKREIALANGISNYIELDCRESSVSFIKNSIMTSSMPKIFHFTEDDIDWIECDRYSLSSKVVETWKLWDGGITDLNQISDIVGISRRQINKYLSYGAKIGKCTYDPDVSKNLFYGEKRKISGKKVICLNTLEIFECINDAEKFCNSNNVSKCCKGEKWHSTAGIHPKTGEKCKWSYYDEYLKTIDKNGGKN